MKARLFSAVLTLAMSASVSACHAGDLPKDQRGECLRALALGAEVPVHGYPLSVLEDAWRKRGGSSTLAGNILELKSHDALTGANHTLRLQLQPGPTSYRSNVCGPQSQTVSRGALDGQPIPDLQLLNFMVSTVEGAGRTLGMAAPYEVGNPHVLLPGQKTIMHHVAPVAVPQTHYGQLTPNAAVQAALASQAAPQPSMRGPSNPAPGANGDAGFTPAYNSCMNSGDAANGVTVALLNCAAAETTRQDVRLNQAYKAKMAVLPPGQQQALRTSERDWIKSRDATCKAASDEDAGGSLAGVIYAQCVVKQEAGRAVFLEHSR